MTDHKQLKQVIIVLIGNAVKFTFKGSITIHVALAKDNKFIHIAVIDTGNGIKPQLLSTIFNPFSLSATNNTELQTAIGMNLYMCKKLIELMNGYITVSSNVSNGTVFVIRLPYIPNETTQSLGSNANTAFKIPLASELVIHRSSNSFYRVLVVDDSIFNCTVLTKLLREYKFTIDIAMNGKEACEKAECSSYLIIFMDINMPVMNGIEATIEIRRKIKSKNYIIAVTAQDTFEDHSNIFDAIFFKPIKLCDLKRVVESILQMQFTLPINAH